MQMGVPEKGGGGRGEMSHDSRKGKKRQKKSTRVQRLYDSCKEVFADSEPDVVPSPENVQKIAAILDGMSGSDVGLSPNMPFFGSQRPPVITYLHLHECDKFSIGIFCMPPNSVIPLHNHPQMTVFSKLLFGTVHIASYDWSNQLVPSERDGLRLARVKVDSEFTAPCKTSILYPADGGNMHCFTAKTACAVLDVLGPPYSDPNGRHCQYYYDFPFSHLPAKGEESEGEAKEYRWLKERDNPEDFYVVGGSYNGPRITKR